MFSRPSVTVYSTLLPCLVVVDFAAKINSAHVFNQDVQCVSLLSRDIHHKCSVSLKQALKNLLVYIYMYYMNNNIGKLGLNPCFSLDL